MSEETRETKEERLDLAHLWKNRSHKPQRGGWAPGGYLCRCSVCECLFCGDKRAVVCSDCAYKDQEAFESALEKAEKGLAFYEGSEKQITTDGEPVVCMNHEDFYEVLTVVRQATQERTGWHPESHWDGHKDYPVDDWKLEVSAGNTRQSYIQWVNSRLEEEV